MNCQSNAHRRVCALGVFLMAACPTGGKAASPSTVSLVAAPNPSTYGHSVTLVADVSPTEATGKVTFFDGTTALGTAAVVSGTAQMSNILLLPGGMHALSAYYSGDASFNPNTSIKVAQIVEASPATAFVQTKPFLSATSGLDNATPVTGDFNGDGQADVVTFNGFVVQVFLGDGNGGLTLAGNSETVPSAQRFSSLAVGDFNQDGKMDLAIVGNDNGTSGNLNILLGDGLGGFSTANGSPYAVGIPGLGARSSAAVGDFNGDGKVDVVVATSNPVLNGVDNGSLYLFLGNGRGDFAITASSPLTLSLPAYFVTTGDFNNDGKTDLAVTMKTPANDFGFGVFLGDGFGGMAQTLASPYLLGKNGGSFAFPIVVADFDGDGNADIAGGNGFVMLGNGSGGFAAAKGSPFSSLHCSASQSVFAVDINGDGKLDLVCGGSREDPAHVGVGLGDGLGGFTDGSYCVLTSFCSLSRVGFLSPAISIGDFNGDGKVDVVAVGADSNTPKSSGVSLLLGIVRTTITNVTSTTANGTYGSGSNIVLQANFSAAVNVTGAPQIAMNSGGTAHYTSGLGTSTLTFTYTIAPGQNAAHLDYNSSFALSLAGGTITDEFSRPAVLTLPFPGAAASLGANKNIVIDTSRGVSNSVVLSISMPINSDRIDLYWPATAVGYQLESSPVLAPAQWKLVEGPPAIVADEWHLSVKVLLEGSRFFRLAKPPARF